MKKIFWTTTEYLVKISDEYIKGLSDHIPCGDKFSFFASRAAAQNDVNWMKDFLKKDKQRTYWTKKYMGPRVVKVTFEVLK